MSALSNTFDIPCKELGIGKFKKLHGSHFLSLKQPSSCSTKIEKEELMNLSFLRLAFYIAHAAITAYSFIDTRITRFARSYCDLIDFLFDTSSKDLRLLSGAESFFRDFSKTSRRGEIAQGLIYAFAMEKLNATAVFDFDDFIKMHNPNSPLPNSKKPDYVAFFGQPISCANTLDLWNGVTRKYGTVYLLESKSCSEARERSRCFFRGLTQCESGVRVLNSNLPGIDIQLMYASAAKISSKSRSEIYLIDPPPMDRFPQRIEHSCLECEAEPYFYELSKWFVIAGQLELAKDLRFKRRLSEETCEQIRNTRGHLGSWKLLNDDAVVNIRLDNKLIEWLCERDINKPLPDFRNRREGAIEFFKDGIIVELSSKGN